MTASASPRPRVYVIGTGGKRRGRNAWHFDPGISMVHVPYKGTGPAFVEFVGGQVDLMLLSLPGALSLARS